MKILLFTLVLAKFAQTTTLFQNALTVEAIQEAFDKSFCGGCTVNNKECN
jgi:hypothetical protein